MKISDFSFDLPSELIAQTPIIKRDNARLLVVDKQSGEREHRNFTDIGDYFNRDDVLVLNNTKVLPARLIGEKKATGAKIELFLLRVLNDDVWECLVKPFKRIKEGDVVEFNGLSAKCLKKNHDGLGEFKFIYVGDFYELLFKIGHVPLPPYITTNLVDKDRYQTVYAKCLGSVAAPTAGLHFTEEILKVLKQKGVKIVYVTLHVGLGTFRPISVDSVIEHQMHSESYEMSEEAANVLNLARKNKNKIVAVGTTTVRTLETVMKRYNKFQASSGGTNIFIYPGYKFLTIDCLITNFHLPKSTLLLLVCAFANKEIILNAYQEAIKLNYRFFSFGDCMLIK